MPNHQERFGGAMQVQDRRFPLLQWTSGLSGLLLFLMLLGPVRPLQAEVVMNTHGWITLESYIHGQRNDRDLNRSHRSEFTGIVDLYSWRALTFTFLLGNTTDIGHFPDSTYYMDRITYSLTYGARLDLGRWVIRGDYHHDCIHLINRPELAGSTWWNAYLLRVGSRGAFNRYLPEAYNRRADGLWKRWDARVGFASYLKAGNSIRNGNNHIFRYEFSNLLRYRLGSTKKLIAYADLYQQYWIDRDESTEYKGSINFNLLLKGESHYAGFFYEYHFYDTYIKDNENGLGAIGFRILF